MILLSALYTNIIFYSLMVIALTLLIFLYIYPSIKRYKESKHFNKFIYRKVYAIAMLNDYYLINNLPLYSENDEEYAINIDHILISNKFMYVIKDLYYKDVINGNKNDKVWLSYDKLGRTTEFKNPLMLNLIRCDRFSEAQQIDRSYFISIVVVNNDIQMKNIDDISTSNSYICKKKDLKKLISKIEKRNVSNFNPEGLEKAVMKIAKDLGRKY